jgi:hypothetical protein
MCNPDEMINPFGHQIISGALRFIGLLLATGHEKDQNQEPSQQAKYP